MEEASGDGKKPVNGTRNLLLLSVFSVVFAIVTTVVGLYLYISSGDIYLDRSLPGLLPEKSEKEEEGREEQYVFSDSGVVDAKVLEDFLESFGEMSKEIEGFKGPFAAEPLSDEVLIFMPEGEE